MPSVWNPASQFLPQAQAAGTLMYQRFVATAAQTLFTLTDFAYDVGTKSLFVFKNGLMVAPVTGYVESSETSFTLLSAAAASDEIVAFGFVGITGDVVVGDGTAKVNGADVTQSYLASKIQATAPIIATVTDIGGGALALVLSLDASNILENAETATITGDFKYTGSKADPDNLATQGDVAAATSSTPTATLAVYNHDTFGTFF